jgi:hypothetical protein
MYRTAARSYFGDFASGPLAANVAISVDRFTMAEESMSD